MCVCVSIIVNLFLHHPFLGYLILTHSRIRVANGTCSFLDAQRTAMELFGDGFIFLQHLGLLRTHKA